MKEGKVRWDFRKKPFPVRVFRPVRAEIVRRITEQAKLEGTHKNHAVQLLAPHRTIPSTAILCLRALPKRSLRSVTFAAVTIP